MWEKTAQCSAGCSSSVRYPAFPLRKQHIVYVQPISHCKGVSPGVQTTFVSSINKHEQTQALLQSYSGGSIGGAVKLNHGQADVVINWSGGLHHAKKAEVQQPIP